MNNIVIHLSSYWKATADSTSGEEPGVSAIWEKIDDDDGYKLCSLNLTGVKRMSGICINKIGKKEEVKGRLVE